MRDQYPILQDLEMLLEREEQQFRSLIRQANIEHQALLAGDIFLLLQATEIKKGLLNEILQTQEERGFVVNEWSRFIGLQSEHISLIDILPSLESTAAARLQILRAGILKLVAELRRLTDNSRILAQGSHDRLQGLHTYLVESSNPSKGYKASGELELPASIPSQEIEGWA